MFKTKNINTSALITLALVTISVLIGIASLYVKQYTASIIFALVALAVYHRDKFELDTEKRETVQRPEIPVTKWR